MFWDEETSSNRRFFLQANSSVFYMIARNLTISRDKTDNDITDSVLKEAMEMTNLSAFVIYPTDRVSRL
jgi:hypothetical protein